MAALDQMLIHTPKYLPATQHDGIKRITGRLMGAVAMETINQAIKAFPELNPDEETWVSVAISKGLGRSSER